ncbi:hypothetical protein ACO4C2_09370 [Streptococcus equinus]
MRDHCSVSIDSRNKSIGTTSDEQLVGKLTFRLWPLMRLGEVQ